MIAYACIKADILFTVLESRQKTGKTLKPQTKISHKYLLWQS